MYESIVISIICSIIFCMILYMHYKKNNIKKKNSFYLLIFLLISCCIYFIHNYSMKNKVINIFYKKNNKIEMKTGEPNF